MAWQEPECAILEAGYAHLFNGAFLERAPNATRQGDVDYSFTEFTVSF